MADQQLEVHEFNRIAPDASIQSPPGAALQFKSQGPGLLLVLVYTKDHIKWLIL